MRGIERTLSDNTRQPKGFIIREAVVDDAAPFLEFLDLVGAETDNLTFGAEGFPFNEEQERAYIKNMHENEHSVTLLALKDGRIIGDASISGLSRRMSHRANLGISVLRDFWHIGVGSALLQGIVDYAKAHGVEIIDLEVRCDNTRAISLYERFGFKRIGTYPAFYKINEEYVDFDIMYLDLR